MKRQLAVIAVALFVVSAIGPGPGSGKAVAASQICRQLETSLEALAGDGNSDRRIARRYAEAIRTQQRQMAKVQQQRRRAGCDGSVIRSGQHAGNACRSLERTLERMHRNLGKLRREHDALAGGGPDLRRERRRLLASLEANHCRAGEPGGTDLVRQEPGVYRVMPARQNGIGQHFRTMCVRTCDGYYFPISYDVPPDAFNRDAATCAARCPGTNVELYVYQVPDENAEEMISRAGAPYKDLPNAFLYRQPGFERPPQCGCGRKTNSSIIESGSDVISGKAPVSEPVHNLSGVQSSGTPTESVAPAENGVADRKVRVVGPEFFPDPEEAIDLRSPAPNGAR